MKTYRSPLFSFILVLVATTIASAQWSVGLRGGAYTGTVSKPELFTTITPDFRWSPALNLAIFAERELSENVAIRSELALVQKGFMMKEGTTMNVGKVPVRLGVSSAYRVSYVEAPVLLKLAAGNELAKVYAIVGPSVGYAADARIITRPHALIDFRPIRTDISMDAIGYQRFELSGIAGAGISLKAGAGEIMAEARYQQGFSRLLDVPVVQANVRNQGVSVSVGYKLPF